MTNKVLFFIENLHKPVMKKIIKWGWEYRLFQRQQKTDFVKLSSQQKREVREYWNQYGKRVNPNWVAYFTTLSKNYDKKFIPESLYYSEIQPYLNNQDVGWALSDKNISSNLFTSKMPKTLLRKINNEYFTGDYKKIDQKEAVKKLIREENVIIKPANGTYGGRNITFWSNKQDLKKLEDALNYKGDLIIQAIVKQHPELAKFHQNSLNTVRIVTLKINNKTVVLNAILRMGVNGSNIDNYSAGGVIANLHENGELFEVNIQANGQEIKEHPSTQVKFKGQKVPNFESILEDAKRQHNIIPYFRLISWDYAVNVSGEPVLIEGNYPSGQLDLHQLNKGSLFGKYTDQVLQEVYKRRP